MSGPKVKKKLKPKSKGGYPPPGPSINAPPKWKPNPPSGPPKKSGAGYSGSYN